MRSEQRTSAKKLRRASKISTNMCCTIRKNLYNYYSVVP